MDAAGRIKFGGNDVTEKFTCPGCKKLPEETVYQCQNGHVICHKCHPRLEICPRDLCRRQLDQSAPLRNASVQTFLDGFKADCPFQENGCETNKMFKHLVSNHGAECLFNFQKFGQLVNLCQKLGYPACDFKVNDGNTAAAIEHFQSVHGFHLAQSDQLQMELEQFKEAVTEQKIRYWTPVIVKSARQGHLLILPMQNEVKGFTCVSIWFPDSQNSRPLWLQSLIHVEYTMPQRDRSQSCNLSFAQRPVSIAQADSILLENLPHSIQGRFLTDHMRDEGAMQIICKIKETSTTTAMQGRMTTFICKMNPPLQIDTSTGDTEKTKKRVDDAEDSSKVDREALWNFLWEIYEEKSKDEGYTRKELAYLMKKAIPLVLRQGTVPQLGYLRVKGYNFECDYEAGVTNLQYVLREDKDKTKALEKVKAVVSFGVDVQGLDMTESGLLHFSASYGNEETVKYVVEELKLDVNSKSMAGLTPFHCAVRNEDEDCAMKIVQLLLDHGAHPGIESDLLVDYLKSRPNYKEKLEKMLRQHREKNLNKDSSV